ncbi:condensation domain-containing protein, partial [Francisella philomiragia]|uniref:condensation domain-containing protein n=1 Tax=Francisella philomiragia TaxID=28110 RepID=UPI001C9D7663
APISDLEVKMCRIWEEVLGLDRVGVTDNFFRIGGNSILAIKLVGLLNIKLQIQLKVKDIFDCKNISKLSLHALNSNNKFKYKDYIIKPDKRNLYKPFNLTNVQQAYLYGRLSNFEMGNISTHGYSELLFSEFDVIKFERALNILIDRYDTLRIIFVNDQQTVLENTPSYNIIDHGEIRSDQIESIRNRLSHKIYDVSKWPLFDFEISYCESKYSLHMSFDGLIMDGSSMGIFFNQLSLLYNSFDINYINMPQVDITFRDYILALEKVRSSELFEIAKQYWINKLSFYNFEAQLPMIVKPSDIKQPKFLRLTKTIDENIWNELKQKANIYKVSLTTVVLYIYGQVLTKYSGSSRFCINLTLFNRLPLHEQVNNILGDFTVLELFNFDQTELTNNIANDIRFNHEKLWDDIEHNLFDGVDFQRLVRKECHIRETQSLSPIVLTSVLGNKDSEPKLKGYIGSGYSITQTSQVYLDNKAYETSEGFVAEWDYVEQLFDSEVISSMHKAYCDLIEYLAESDWEEKLPELILPELDRSIIESANGY